MRGATRFAGRTWVLDAVLDWLAPGGSRFLVLKGEPGAGKSAFAAWIAGHGRVPADPAVAAKLATVRSAWSAVHFARFKAGGTIEPQRFAGSLAKQLADRSDEFARHSIKHVAPEIHIEQTIRENWGRTIAVEVGTLIVGSRDAADVYNKAVRLPLQDLYAEGVVPTADGQVFVLVDGLDESLHYPRHNIFDLLAASEDLPAEVRFLVTTRDIDRISELRGRTVLDLSAPQYAEDNDRDVREYLELRLGEEAVRQRASATTDTSEIVESLVARAHGNFLFVEFLLDEVAGGSRDLEDLAGVPDDLFPLYRSYLDRLVPSVTEPGGGTFWHQELQPLLGSLCVASPAAPQTALPRWLEWEADELATRLGYVTQLTEVVPDVQDERPGYRVYHRSFADFLAASDYPDEGEPTRNPYFVPPARQHRRIAQYYLARGPGPARDWRLVDRYGLRQLVPHLRAWLDLSTDRLEQDEAAAQIYDVILDEAFVTRQCEQDEVVAAATGIRLALEAAEQRDDGEALEAIVTLLAGNLDPELRAVAREGVQRLQETKPELFAGLTRRLLR